MEYGRLGKTGLNISRIGLGCWNFGSSNPRWGKPGKVIEADAAVNIIHQAIDKGINFFDTANRYTGGESEEILGRAIRGHRDHDGGQSEKICYRRCANWQFCHNT
ncbi:aldo/keto reductase [Paenibacillus piri]|uniref:Aldo/keto reductase n=1 Tax=Paenibacillus piri TaxID=2547395 RepID=A0A4R5KBJ0_9BACL|nr:aldo/keto reductase [Paenibacillus piri]TDF91350.1 aldo/keto reductase [Paenibacillus piri]